MIPKIVHYCWFGRNPLPDLAVKCIESWKRFLPEYEIKEWNEDNFDVNIIPYTKEAYEHKKYAFVSDYARFWVLHKYGGLYFDTDVELIKPIDDIVSNGNFMGCESDIAAGAAKLSVAPGLVMGVEANDAFIKKLIELYNTLSFLDEEGNVKINKTIVDYTTEMFETEGLKNIAGIQTIAGYNIYPAEYFCPINAITKRMHVTENTRSIHHYAASWVNKTRRDCIKKFIRKLLPEKFLFWWNKRDV
ncbi:MAG: glycosyltransferase [Prevotella sp.]|uniref:glycosyltransferase family 32 protein n=1 Tax=Prevotella sp. TaxID=59823 RepID=UPI002A2E0DDB|nr:glycosyltransferase [Prevotella sp.]MDD7317919.1 glycosyltransferase [Prevotellaceae bacterium]MDY4020810.1 glycosyltransferase [Prevotella sp.]